ncbi:MAG TPA: phosphomannomutase/phosphoglucomutase [Acidimicrobiia bacterium]|nr:phosphomannomutase/phosphoglucomutase [Acidimicrobiia bacterium]
MNPDAVFKAYDIRGRTDIGELDPELFRKTGHAFVTLFQAEEVAVGRDVRESSPGLFAGLAEGINQAGSDVIDLGEVPTDLVYFYTGKYSVPGAIITASHNPAEYNGLKLCRAGAAPVGADTGLAEIKEIVLRGEIEIAPRRGIVREVDAVDDYVDHLLSIVDSSSIGPLRVAVDGGNGMAGVTVTRVFKRLAATLDGLYLEPDGTFPNHPADPIQLENLQDLIEKVSSGGHELGVAFDGDADRAFFIDDQASPLSGSTVTALIARWMLRRHPGATIIHNLITSRAVAEVVREAGGVPVRTRVGHSYIKQVMAESGAVFGGEHSGHYYFLDNYRADSGMLAMLILMRVISEDGRPLSALRREVELYAASGEINYEVRDPQVSIDQIEAAFPDAEIDRLDGLSIDLGESWFNLRASNTEPLLRLNVEARDPGTVEDTVRRIEEIIEEQE